MTFKQCYGPGLVFLELQRRLDKLGAKITVTNSGMHYTKDLPLWLRWHVSNPFRPEVWSPFNIDIHVSGGARNIIGADVDNVVLRLCAIAQGGVIPEGSLHTQGGWAPWEDRTHDWQRVRQL